MTYTLPASACVCVGVHSVCMCECLHMYLCECVYVHNVCMCECLRMYVCVCVFAYACVCLRFRVGVEQSSSIGGFELVELKEEPIPTSTAEGLKHRGRGGRGGRGGGRGGRGGGRGGRGGGGRLGGRGGSSLPLSPVTPPRSEEHTSELQSR